MLEPAQGLSPETLEALAELEVDTVAADGGRLKLEWSTLRSRSGDEVNDLLWWEQGKLVGFIGLYTFGATAVEAAGMVHPDFRRRGIGSSLLDEVIVLCRERDHDKLLLVIPRTSVGGRFLAEANGGVFDHSEHALDLYGEVANGPSDTSLNVRTARSDDISDVARILTEAFGHPWRPPDPESPQEPTLVAECDGTVVATLRVHKSQQEWGIYGFAVQPSHKGRGIGRGLLRRVCSQANEAGVKRVHLEVEVDNDRALGLYTSLGFRRSSTEDYFCVPI